MLRHFGTWKWTTNGTLNLVSLVGVTILTIVVKTSAMIIIYYSDPITLETEAVLKLNKEK